MESGELHHLPAAEAFFDDRGHLSTVRCAAARSTAAGLLPSQCTAGSAKPDMDHLCRELCSYTHPALATPEKSSPKFKSFQELERVMKGSKSQSFCRICVSGRKVGVSLFVLTLRCKEAPCCCACLQASCNESSLWHFLQVFISEQVVYSDADLHKHLRTGDLTGPMAESGFKGHPQCRYGDNAMDFSACCQAAEAQWLRTSAALTMSPSCRFCHKRFYGDNEIFNHMQQEHEQCFLCRRDRPDKFIYFRDYNELEGGQRTLVTSDRPGLAASDWARLTESAFPLAADHFRQEHFACGHQTCLERKFVVFASEQELRNHQGKEHGGTMSRAERRQALTVPINFQVPSLFAYAWQIHVVSSASSVSVQAFCLTACTVNCIRGNACERMLDVVVCPVRLTCQHLTSRLQLWLAVLQRSGRSRSKFWAGHHHWRAQRPDFTLPKGQCCSPAECKRGCSHTGRQPSSALMIAA